MYRMSMQNMILIVEDEKAIRDLLSYHLRKQGFELEEASHAEEALKKISLQKPSLIILDLMLPKLSGLEFCKMIRGKSTLQDIPILMLTAKSSKEDIVQGLEMGADDYVTKPFDIREVMARIHAILRRNDAKESASSIFSYKDLKVDWER